MAAKTYELLMPMQVDSTTRLEAGDPRELDDAEAKRLISAGVVKDPKASTDGEKPGAQTSAPGGTKTAAQRKAETEKAAAEKAAAEKAETDGS